MQFGRGSRLPRATAPRLAGKFAIALVACLAVRVLWAQAPTAGPAIPEGQDARGYKVLIPVASLYGTPAAKAKAQQQMNIARKTLSGEQPLAENRAQLENLYNLYYFPYLTQTGDNELKNLANERQNFLRDLELSGRNPEAHNLLTSLALARLTPIVRDDKFHPAVRYNAMMIIGSLNDQEFLRGSGTPTLPVPMLRALPILLEEFRRPANPDSIKLAALLGLSRHLEWENEKPQNAPPMPANLRQDVIKELLTLAQANQAPAGRDVAGHLWLRRRAVEALGHASAKKPNPEIAVALESLLKDDAQPVPLRVTTAAIIGKISYQAPAKADPQATAKELGYVALLACDAELNRLAALKKEEQDHAMRMMGQMPDSMSSSPGMMQMSGGYGTGGGDGGLSGGMGVPGSIRRNPADAASGLSIDSGYGTPGYVDPTMMDPKAYRFDPARRRIRHDLFCVQLGLTGGEDRKPAGSAPTPPPAGAVAVKGEPRGMYVLTKPNTPDQKFVDEVYQRVRKMVEIVETKAIDVLTLDKDLRKEMKILENTIGKRLPVAATATGSLASDLPGAPAAGVARPMGMPPGGFRGPAGCF